MLRNLVLVIAAFALSILIGAWALSAASPEVFYKAPTQPYAEYLAKRDPVLGWSTKGARPDDFPGAPCISVFGDSFTFSEEVGDADAWPAVLSKLLGCRVENYGVGGYGTDQAFLRFKTTEPRAKIVLLDHLSENVIRNVNQFRNFIAPSPDYQFKPRFLPSGELVTLPEIGDIEAFNVEPARFLPYEYFLPQVGIRTRLITGHLEAKLFRRPSYAEFYQPDHPSQALAATVAILQAFVREATARGQVPIIGIIPTCRDLTLGMPYRPLLESLKDFRVIDFGAEFANRTHEPERLFAACSAHPNRDGYRMLAEIAADRLSALIAR